MSFRLENYWEFGSSWHPLDAEFRKGHPNHVIGKLDHFLSTQRAFHAEDQSAFYPEEKDIFRAFRCTSLDEVKVVILGQDPYHNGQATGLAFSVEDRKLTSSLHSIYAALEADLGRNPHSRASMRGRGLAATCTDGSYGARGRGGPRPAYW